jgi:beta-lactamase regulating signal transducer with metallopeptidase domain
MAWQHMALNLLVQTAAGGLIVLAAGSLATHLCRQPVRRARLVLLTLVATLMIPALGTLPFAPAWPARLVRPVKRVWRERLAPSAALARRLTIETVRLAGDPNPHPADLSIATGPAPAPAPAAAKGTSPRVNIRWRRLALVTYAGASSGLFVWWVIGQWLLWRVTRAAWTVPAAVRSTFDAISGPAGQSVRLLQSDHIEFPFTYTWFRPVILLPTALVRNDGGEDAALRYCLAHEWSHIERRDAWAWNLAVLAGALLFYQPLFWWLRRQLRLCQDFLADDRAAMFGSPEDYAGYLVRLAGRRVRRRPAAAVLPALGIDDRSSNLHRRVSMLVTDREPLERRCPAVWSLGAALGTALAMLIVSGLRLDAAAPANDPKPAPEKPAPSASEVNEGDTLHYSGKVKDKESGKPIAGATVVVRRSTPDPKNGGHLTIEESRHTTNAEGVYSFTIPPAQAAQKRLYIELDVEHPDYATRAGFGYSLAMIRKNETLGERPFFENIELRPARPILGRIETPDGEAAQGIELLAYSNTDKFKPGEGPFEYGSFSKAVTDRDGRFRIPVVTPGPAVFWILPRAYAPAMHSVPGDKRGDFGTFVIQKGVTVAGRVFGAHGQPLAGLFVEIQRVRGSGPDSEILNRLSVSDAIQRKTETDAEGRFTFDPMPAGSFQVEPIDYQRVPGKGLIRRPLPAVFAPQKITLTDGETPEPLELRATPHVVIEGGWVDSQGKPRSGWELMVSGQIDGQFWHMQGLVSGDGKFSVKVPHGLERAQIMIMINEHAAMRHRIGPDGKLSTNRLVMLGTLDRDVKDLEIIRYEAPVVLIKAITSDGRPVKDVTIAGQYLEEKEDAGFKFSLKNGIPSDVRFEKQDDGRFRSTQLTPDRAVNIIAHAEGFPPESRTFKLPEGKTEEVTFVLKAK